MRSESRFRVLHLDDDEEVLRVTNRVLSRVDDRFEFTGVTSADDALSRLEDDYDCVVTDSVTTSSGEPFAVAAKRHAPGVPILLFSGQSGPALETMADRVGAAAAVSKEGSGSFAALGTTISRLADETPTVGAGQDWQVVAEYDFAREGLAYTLVEALTEVSDDDPDAIDLSEVIDLETLEALLSGSSDVRVAFVHRDWEIAVDGTGTVAVRPLE